MVEHEKSHGSGGHGGCKHNVTGKYYIPREKMSTVDKIIDDRIFKTPNFFKENGFRNMNAILLQVNQAYKSI